MMGLDSKDVKMRGVLYLNQRSRQLCILILLAIAIFNILFVRGKWGILLVIVFGLALIAQVKG